MEEFLGELSYLMEKHDVSMEPSSKGIEFDSEDWACYVVCDYGIITPTEIIGGE